MVIVKYYTRYGIVYRCDGGRDEFIMKQKKKAELRLLHP